MNVRAWGDKFAASFAHDIYSFQSPCLDKLKLSFKQSQVKRSTVKAEKRDSIEYLPEEQLLR